MFDKIVAFVKNFFTKSVTLEEKFIETIQKDEQTVNISEKKLPKTRKPRAPRKKKV